MKKTLWMACILMMALLIGCKEPPKKALSDAEKALLAAAGRKQCASDRYEAAKKLLDEAKALVKAEKYDEAERKAVAAEKLATLAKKEADDNWEECNKRNTVITKATKPKEDPPKTDVPPAELNTVFFAYDSSDLTTAQRTILDQNALWMRQNPNKSIVLEGHTDERGSVEYNLALGERRARAVQQYMINLGVDSGRMRILSYGEEKPMAFGQSSDDHRQNRRVEFIPQKK